MFGSELKVTFSRGCTRHYFKSHFNTSTSGRWKPKGLSLNINCITLKEDPVFYRFSSFTLLRDGWPEEIHIITWHIPSNPETHEQNTTYRITLKTLMYTHPSSGMAPNIYNLTMQCTSFEVLQKTTSEQKKGGLVNPSFNIMTKAFRQILGSHRSIEKCTFDRTNSLHWHFLVLISGRRLWENMLH